MGRRAAISRGRPATRGVSGGPHAPFPCDLCLSVWKTRSHVLIPATPEKARLVSSILSENGDGSHGHVSHRGKLPYHGAQPDGDSIRFTPDDPAKWDLITGTQVKRNASGAAQLRLDAIDALETHYAPHALISRSAWRTRPPTSCSTGWDSPMSFAHKTKRSHPALLTRLSDTS